MKGSLVFDLAIGKIWCLFQMSMTGSRSITVLIIDYSQVYGHVPEPRKAMQKMVN